MEQNPPILAKKLWSLMRVMFFMLKKSISKTRFFSDLNMLTKRSKIAGKSLHNLLFHHHHHNRHPHHLPFPTPPPSDDEFSCTTTPQHPFSHAPPSVDDIVEMLTSAAASPGFGKSPVVKQLRITDSPFPLSNGDGHGQVDEAAEKFIKRFYNSLRQED